MHHATIVKLQPSFTTVQMTPASSDGKTLNGDRSTGRHSAWETVKSFISCTPGPDIIRIRLQVTLVVLPHKSSTLTKLIAGSTASIDRRISTNSHCWMFIFE